MTDEPISRDWEHLTSSHEACGLIDSQPVEHQVWLVISLFSSRHYWRGPVWSPAVDDQRHLRSIAGTSARRQQCGNQIRSEVVLDVLHTKGLHCSGAVSICGSPKQALNIGADLLGVCREPSVRRGWVRREFRNSRPLFATAASAGLATTAACLGAIASQSRVFG